MYLSSERLNEGPKKNRIILAQRNTCKMLEQNLLRRTRYWTTGMLWNGQIPSRYRWDQCCIVISSKDIQEKVDWFLILTFQFPDKSLAWALGRQHAFACVFGSICSILWALHSACCVRHPMDSLVLLTICALHATLREAHSSYFDLLVYAVTSEKSSQKCAKASRPVDPHPFTDIVTLSCIIYKQATHRRFLTAESVIVAVSGDYHWRNPSHLMAIL